MTYQELVQRVIACRHADLELGLSKRAKAVCRACVLVVG